MLSENEKVNWMPAHLKEGRFRHIMETAPDWTISRNRFWASPLPIWKEKGGKGVMVIGSVEELLEKTKRSGNSYFVMRHGEAQSNVEDKLDGLGRPDNHLTEAGREHVRASAEELKKKTSIDLIVTSPFLRTRETAAIVQKIFGLPDSAVAIDSRLHEVGFGVFEGRPLKEWGRFLRIAESEVLKGAGGRGIVYGYTPGAPGTFCSKWSADTWEKKILIVTHKGTGWLLNGVARRHSIEQAGDEEEHAKFMRKGEVYELPFVSVSAQCRLRDGSAPSVHRRDYARGQEQRGI